MVLALTLWAALPLTAISQTPSSQDALIRDCILKLGDDDLEARENAREQLLRIAEPARKALEEAAAGKDPQVAGEARSILRSITLAANLKSLPERWKEVYYLLQRKGVSLGWLCIRVSEKGTDRLLIREEVEVANVLGRVRSETELECRRALGLSPLSASVKNFLGGVRAMEGTLAFKAGGEADAKVTVHLREMTGKRYEKPITRSFGIGFNAPCIMRCCLLPRMSLQAGVEGDVECATVVEFPANVSHLCNSTPCLPAVFEGVEAAFVLGKTVKAAKYSMTSFDPYWALANPYDTPQSSCTWWVTPDGRVTGDLYVLSTREEVARAFPK